MKQFVPAVDTGCAKMADCNDQAMRQHNKAAVSGPLLCGKSGHADSNHVLGLLSRKGKPATRVSARAELLRSQKPKQSEATPAAICRLLGCDDWCLDPLLPLGLADIAQECLEARNGVRYICN
jgi:hypothetical protein